MTSTDLDLTVDGPTYTVGMRFNAINIPKNAIIQNAYIQFQADEVNTTAATLQIMAQATDNAPTFSTATGNISSRAVTATVVSWVPEPWTAIGQAGAAQQTPNIAAVIKEIIDRSNWTSGNSLVLIITGTGTRTAESYEGLSSAAPLLHIEYVN